MISDFGLHDMQNNKRNGKSILTIVLIALVVLVALLFIGAEISATANDKQENASVEENKGLSNGQSHEEKATEAPTIFQPTEKVTADQAVAFPTDI